MDEETAACYEELYTLCVRQEQPLAYRYRRLRSAWERMADEGMQGSGLQSTDGGTRIHYLAARYGLDDNERQQLHTFRLTSNDILNHRKEPAATEFLRDVCAVARAYRKICGQPWPERLAQIAETFVETPAAKSRAAKHIRRMRVCFDHADDTYLYVYPTDTTASEPIRAAYNLPGVNEEFRDTAKALWRHAQLNLLDVSVSEGIYAPSFLVLEPDYLMDISSLAECYRDYGSHPANYFMSRLTPIENTGPLLLGNIANLFLDEWIHAGEEEPTFVDCMKKAFRQYPIELAACAALRDPAREKAFARDCRMHFEHIKETVQHTFREPGYALDKRDAVLEPAYICEALGIQGRLDYMQRDMSRFIEMKSGKADEYAQRGKVVPKESHLVQMLLYMAVLEYSMGQPRHRTHPYLLYTRYPLLYPAQASWAQVKRAINLRNRIVAEEYGVQLHNRPAFARQLLEQIHPETLNEKKLRGKFWQQYLKPSISRIGDKLSALGTAEQAYFYALYHFITKELYIAKAGRIDGNGRSGASALWLGTLDEKCEAGEILYDLEMVENKAAQWQKPYIVLSIPTYEETFLPNFRAGDVVLLYERNSPADNVCNQMVFKGNIEEITDDSLRIRLRAPQRNASVFPPGSRYAVEHDSMDTTFRTMYLGLSAFLDADPGRRDLLLGRRPPRFDTAQDAAIAAAADDFERVALKAEAARDYFLLVGPPGTGKTSRALRRMVEHFHAQPSAQLLLLAYTNRAVDEICQSLAAISPAVAYIRIGNELACDPRFAEHLLTNVLAACPDRRSVHRRMESCRIYVGTVASVASKPELFRLKHFDTMIVDEATQILEPQLLGILCARTAEGRNAVDRFILIGDHKQLPAVVLQSGEQSEVPDEELRKIGFRNLKDSLFERLYRAHAGEEHPRATDMLCRQGRMHPAVALFPNRAVYAGKLDALGLPHQLEAADRPVRFIPSRRDADSLSGKTNRSEAQIVANLAKDTFRSQGEAFDPDRTLGVITSYRSQIALIRKEIRALGIPALESISVDTVERYQGSERDVIIYSFSVNHLSQLKYLPNLLEEDGTLIDRKLNVVLTRARKQLFLTGVPEILCHNPLYRRLMQFLGP